jgi:hypothetical protein
MMFDKFALILSLPIAIAIGIVYRFYVNLHDSKYLHVRFVICAGSNAYHITCLNHNSV